MVTGLPWHRNQVELLEQAETIRLVPDFDSLPSSKADDGDPGHRHLLASCGDMHRRHDITAVGATPRRAHHHLVSFSDQVFNRDMEVREGTAGLGDKSFVVCEGANDLSP